jgi:hypothetical protein
MAVTITVHPCYWAVGPRGYQAFYDEKLFNNTIVKAVLTRGGIGRVSVRSTFDEAFGAFYLEDEAADLMVFARYKVTQDARGSTIARVYWLVDWQSFERCGYNYDQIFRQMQKVELARHDLFALNAFHLDVVETKISLDRSDQELLWASVEKLTEIVAGLMAGYRFVVVGIHDLTEKIKFVELLRQLLPKRVGREISFLTDAPELPGTRSALVFAALQPIEQMGRVLRQKGRPLTDVELFFPSRQEGLPDQELHVRRFKNIVQEEIDVFGKEHLLSVALPKIQQLDLPSARLAKPASFVPEIDLLTSSDIFRDRYRRGTTQIDELLYHVKVFGARLPSQDIRHYLLDILQCYAQNQLGTAELQMFDEIFSAPPVDESNVINIVSRLTTAGETSMAALQRLLGWMEKRRSSLAQTDRDSCDRWMAATVAQLLALSLEQKPNGLFAMLSPFAGHIDPLLCGKKIEQSKVDLSANWQNEWLGLQLVDWAEKMPKMFAAQPKEALQRTQVEIARAVCVRVAGNDSVGALVSLRWLVDKTILTAVAAVDLLPQLIPKIDGRSELAEDKIAQIAGKLLGLFLHPDFSPYVSRIAQTTAQFWRVSNLGGSSRLVRMMSEQTAQPDYGALGMCLQELEDVKLFLELFYKMLERFPDARTLDETTASRLTQLVVVLNPHRPSVFDRCAVGLVDKLTKTTLPDNPKIINVLCQSACAAGLMDGYLRLSFQIRDPMLRSERLLEYFRQQLNASQHPAWQQNLTTFLETIDRRYAHSEGLFLSQFSAMLLRAAARQTLECAIFVEMLCRWVATAPGQHQQLSTGECRAHTEPFWELGAVLFKHHARNTRLCKNWLQKFVEEPGSAYQFAEDLLFLWRSFVVGESAKAGTAQLLEEVLSVEVQTNGMLKNKRKKRHQWLYNWEYVNQICQQLLCYPEGSALAEVVLEVRDGAIATPDNFGIFLANAIHKGASALRDIYFCWNYPAPACWRALKEGTNRRQKIFLSAIARQLVVTLDSSYQLENWRWNKRCSRLETNLDQIARWVNEQPKKNLCPTVVRSDPPPSRPTPDLFVGAMYRYFLAQRLYLRWGVHLKTTFSGLGEDSWEKLYEDCQTLLVLLKQRAEEQPQKTLLYHICFQLQTIHKDEFR